MHPRKPSNGEVTILFIFFLLQIIFAVLVIGASLSTMMSFWSWIQDGSSYVRSPFLFKAINIFLEKTSYLDMLYTHWWLLVNLSFMILLYLLGACDKYSAPKL